MSTRNGVLKCVWMATRELPTAASHPFCTRLNHLLREHGSDDFAENTPNEAPSPISRDRQLA